MDPSVLVAGETLVDFLPDSPGPLATVESFDRRAGGAPANVAVRLAQLDRPPWFWTRVGADPFGEFLAATLADHGVPNRFVERDSDAKTTLAFVSQNAEADADYTFYRNGTADTRLQSGTVPDGTLAAVDLVSVGGVALASDPARSAVRNLCERAAARDCTVCFDPNARPELWRDTDFAAEVDGLLPSCDVVFATPGDLRSAGFSGDDPETLAERVRERGPHTVFLTLGEAGSVAFAGEDAPWGPATAEHGGFEVSVVDTTGAGDAFTAGVLASFARGETDLGAVLAFGNAVAAASTTSAGAMGPLSGVDALLNGDSEREQ